MRCCLLRDNGSVVPLPNEDGSEQYYMEPIPMPVKLPGEPTHYVNPKDILWERYPVSGGSPVKLTGFLYAKHQPTANELAAALSCLQGMEPH